MSLTDFLEPDRIISGLRVADKAQLLAELAKLAAARLPVSHQTVLAALREREQLGSTGLGRGFALPHARVEGVARLFGLFVRLARPIPFDAIDGDPVDLVFLLLIPPSAGGEHVAALAAIAREMRDEKTLGALRAASTAADLRQALRCAPAAKPGPAA